jgi:hypothetical protein
MSAGMFGRAEAIHEYSDRRPPAREAQRSFPVCDDADHCRHPDDGDDFPVLRRRNPLPLCLLQRVAMFGVCFGIVLHFRHSYCARNAGFSMLFALFLLIVSVRQTLLDIYPRPGHGYIGSTVLGLHMPVWSVVIAVVILLAFTIKLAVLGGEHLRDPQPSPALRRVAGCLAST